MKKVLVWLCVLLVFAAPALALAPTEWIDLADGLVTPGGSEISAAYPAYLTRGEVDYDKEALLIALLGEGYIQEERNEYSSADEYISADGEQPWEHKKVYIYDDTDALWYWDPMVSSERGAEYEPPQMNMLPDESLVICRALLEGVLDERYTRTLDMSRLINDRWSWAERWMTDAEYTAYMHEKDLHYFLFANTSEAGIPILGDKLLVSVGVNGLNGLDLSWHTFGEAAETVVLMPLQEAIDLANTTREAKTTLFYAQIAYSNWVTENEQYNLGWYLVTSKGSYFVDSVLRAHKCDSYEY